MTRSLALSALSALLGAHLAGCAAWYASGRVLDRPCDHLGVRPASDAKENIAVTVQWSTDRPACREVYRRP
jgi:hypothetical protein